MFDWFQVWSSNEDEMSNSAEEWFSRAYRIHKTINRMLNDRGYIRKDEELNRTKEEFRTVGERDFTAGYPAPRA